MDGLQIANALIGLLSELDIVQIFLYGALSSRTRSKPMDILEIEERITVAFADIELIS